MRGPRTRLTVLRHGTGTWEVSAHETVASVDRLKAAARGAGVLPHLWRYDEVRILTHRLETIGRPLKLALFIRALSRGGCFVDDDRGQRRRLSLGLLARWTWQAVREPFLKSALIQEVSDAATALDGAGQTIPKALILEHSPVYVRSDMSYGLKAGGSVGHIAGVINHLGEWGGAPVMFTTDLVPTVDESIEAHPIPPAEAFWEYPELPTMVMNREFLRALRSGMRERPISFVYQRYSLNNLAGATFARERRVPFVLEYNGSEVWVSRNWGTPLEHEGLSQLVERANLHAADLIVVVSRPMADELLARGVPRERVLVNPNGVEPEIYTPEVDGSSVRDSHGLEGCTVIGFIGTFGPWHGAEVLAEAFGQLIKDDPAYRQRVRLLMIGDGVKMPEVREALTRHGVMDLAVLTGVVPQADGPRYLAACDILASPHVPNADGTPFFGSPTKLFEYMAMGKGIVASDLEQVGEILEHGRAAQMAKPGDVASLREGLRVLIEDPERRQALGREARRLAVERHTWRAHTERIVTRLQEIMQTR